FVSAPYDVDAEHEGHRCGPATETGFDIQAAVETVSGAGYAPSPWWETQVAIARIISALPAYTISESGKISRYVRQRCRTSASSTTYVGVPYWSAISSRETSPMQTRPLWSWRVLMGHNAGSIRGVIAPRREGKISSSVTSIS
ncbi:MAG: hypothetical protein OXC29_03735, partial [Rhodococcus sp.]|nr:hypothetical protein [Rhodococcus sp. (in: high G+C Gram-positive bacteria)]